MAIETEATEKIIADAMSLLNAKHGQYQPEQWTHYVVKGENEDECDIGDYCGNCIDKAVKEHSRKYQSERAVKLLQINDLKTKGYCFTWGYNGELNNKFLVFHQPTINWVKKYERETKKQYPKKVEFSYRYYQMDSDSTFRNCESCGIILQACITADEQEIEHWESDFEDSDFIVSEMDIYTAYELYEIFQFIHQSKQGVYDSGVKLAQRVIDVNKLL